MADKQYKARIEIPKPGIHAMELWFYAPNIVEAVDMVKVEIALPLGIDTGNISKVIEIEDFKN
jgi:hypothetical protein